MQRKIILGTVAAAALTLLAACNRDTSSTTTAPQAQTDATAIQAAQNNEPAPGSRNDTISATKDSVAGAVGKVSAELTTTTQGFVDAAARSDMYEVAAGKLAEMRAHTAELKMFGMKMVEDHTQSTNKLKTVLAKAAPNIMPPSDLDSRHEGLLNDLKGAKDADFDGRYIAQQISAHEETLIVMRGYAKDGDNPDIKAFAAEVVPVVQMHLDMIKDIDRKYRASDAQARNSGNTSRNP
jgi:putative membrane protein